ncbi:hypothetical protein ACP70R_034225 [Stipagrostis hirtigluma subsp. patula]
MAAAASGPGAAAAAGTSGSRDAARAGALPAVAPSIRLAAAPPDVALSIRPAAAASSSPQQPPLPSHIPLAQHAWLRGAPSLKAVMEGGHGATATSCDDEAHRLQQPSPILSQTQLR